MTYTAPVDDISQAFESAAGLSALIEDGVYPGLDHDTIRAIIEEAGRFAAERLAPLNWTGDRAGVTLTDSVVTTPAGWREVYKDWAGAGWAALPCPEEFGGQGLPHLVSTAVGEIWNSANLAFGLCPLLTQGAIDALVAQGSNAIKRKYLPKMISGEWTGTMNLTEPQAGSDLSTMRTRAERAGDGTYTITGTKIYITYGEHDLTQNIIHLVLARLPDAPSGTKGISLFLVPKFLVNDDGTLGARNDVTCVGIEHKLGIHASPTCVMAYGEKGGATGYLVGEENKGLNAMFIMMNAARLAVGVQGVSIAEAATQKALAYARERRQGRASGAPAGVMSAIIDHPDVRRNLMTMKSLTAASRALCFATAAAFDVSERAHDPAVKKAAHMRAALLTPVAKAFSTDIGCEVASIGVQIHGGMGFVEDTGAAQFYRDARILPIYEGTNGIQAIDLVTRKLPLEGGAVVRAYLAELAATVDDVRRSNQPEFVPMAERLGEAVNALSEATNWIAKALATNPDAALAGAAPYLRLFGLTAGGIYLARAALAAARAGDVTASSVITARFFAKNQATAASGLARSVTDGGQALLALLPQALSA